MNAQEVSGNSKGFLKEYKELCNKYGCFILSEGEEVWVVDGSEEMKRTDYWWVEGNTIDRAARGRL